MMKDLRFRYYAGIAIDFVLILMIKARLITFFNDVMSSYFDLYRIKGHRPGFADSFFFQLSFSLTLTLGVLTFCYFLFNGQTVGTRILGVTLRDRDSVDIKMADAFRLSFANTFHIATLGISIIWSFMNKSTLEETVTNCSLIDQEDYYHELTSQNLTFSNVFIPHCPIVDEAKIPAEKIDLPEKIAA
jgi:hypothetical protein